MAAETISHSTLFARLRDTHKVDAVIVGFSGGKDAIVTLELCKQFVPRVEAYFLYIVPGLSFQETYLNYIERRYSLTIHRMPSPTISTWLRDGGYRLPSARAESARRIKRVDIENALRRKLGIEWFATGEKCCDSIERNAMIRRVRGIDPKRRQIWPIAYWNDSAVHNFIKTRNIMLPPDYRFSAGANYKPRSFGSLGPIELAFIRDNYPADYKKITDMFPLIPANLLQQEDHGQEKTSQ